MSTQLREIIFSEKRNYKLFRHFSFWALWWLYFLTTNVLLRQPIQGTKVEYLTPGDHVLLKTLLLILLFVSTSYPVIYFVFPELIYGKWLKAVAYFVLLCCFVFIASYFLYWNVFVSIDSVFGSVNSYSEGLRFWPAVNLGLLNFIKVIAAAIGIKYVKYWWQKQQESRILEKEKLDAELQLLKAQVHPDFLFNTLNNIYEHALLASPQTSDMLLKLSDLLSYMLYECSGSAVLIEKEIEMMKEYMQLEKIRHNDKPEIQVNIKGDLAGKNIAPFLLLPFIENSFRHCHPKNEKFWINIDVSIEKDILSLKLTNGIAETSTPQSASDQNSLANVQKRLFLLYPDRHELKMTLEQEMSIVILNIQLDADPVLNLKNESTSTLAERNEIKTASLKYASD